MSVLPERAVGTLKWENETYGFCSHSCLQRFTSDPARYANETVQKFPHLFGKASSDSMIDESNTSHEHDHDAEEGVYTDPVCGMSVDPEKAGAKLEHEGTTYYFCCHHCAEKFKSDPQKYLTMDAEHEPMAHDSTLDEGVAYICPMDPEVRENKPGSCPKCGMALEPETPVTATAVEYSCPMHPEVVQSDPGACPICGMALEPRTVTVEEEANPELVDMSRRFWWSVALTAPLLVMTMWEMFSGSPIFHALAGKVGNWAQLVLATPVVLWGGKPFFQRGYASIVRRSLNMFTLIALGTGVAYVYSLVATLFPSIFPRSGDLRVQ
jgi:Cu+-exporting ATPase